ncbi:MAG: hypothetical protein ACRCW4_11450 [Candidatus Neomicrothrix subdominans]
MTVTELIEQLQDCPPDAEVRWAGEEWRVPAPITHVEPVERLNGWVVDLM